MEKTDAVVIGAGPVGLFQIFQLGLQGLSCHVIDALPHAGGQCAELYGDKPIYDIPGIKVCTGQELTDRLLEQIVPFAPQWHLGEQASVLAPQPNGGFLVETSSGTQLHARAAFIAAHPPISPSHFSLISISLLAHYMVYVQIRTSSSI